MFRIMRNYFQLADKGNDKKVNENELNKFLKSINLKMDKEELRKLIMVPNLTRYSLIIYFFFLKL